jgi:hypothetical protein
MALNTNAMTYIKFFVFLAPIIIPSMAVLGSFYEGNFKGLFYILGLIITMTFGGLISKTVGHLVPHTGKIGGTGKQGTPDGPFSPIINAACNLVGSGDSESWGLMYSLPGPHALSLAFSAAYFILPMFIYNNVNIHNLFFIGGFSMIAILSAIFRTSSTMNCVSMVDVVAGWGTGFLFGALWFFLVNLIASKANIKDVTYFSNSDSDRQQCKLEKKAFRCKARTKI